MADFVMKQGDTLPLFEFIVKDANGPVRIDSASSVKLHVTRGSTIIIDGSCTIIDDGTPELRGQAKYEWVVADTDSELGTYDMEVEVTFGPNKILTFPNGTKNLKLQINRQLA